MKLSRKSEMAARASKEQKKEKMNWMWRHKSLGTLTGLIVLPRVGYRLANMAKYKIRDLPGMFLKSDGITEFFPCCSFY